MLKTFGFPSLWFALTMIGVIAGFAVRAGLSQSLPDLPNLEPRQFDSVTAPPVIADAVVSGFMPAGRWLRIRAVQPQVIGQAIAQRFNDFRHETAAVRWFYHVLTGLPDGLYMLLIALGGVKSKSGDPSVGGDSLGYVAVVFMFPIVLNVGITVLVLAATPLIRRRSSRPWARAHIRHSILPPLVAIVLIWLAAGLNEYWSCWMWALRD